jgi:hypothetical protein
VKTFALALLIALPCLAHAPPLERLPAVVAAQAEAAPHPTIGDKLLGFVSPEGVLSILTMVGGAIGGLVWFTSRRKKLIALAAYHAFHIVEDIGLEIEGDDGFDKTARYLKELDAFMVANGWRQLKPGEVESAKLQAKALHGAEVAKAKVAAAAAVAATEAQQGP